MNLAVNPINYGLIKEENIRTNLCKNILDYNNILMYLTHNEGKSVIVL